MGLFNFFKKTEQQPTSESSASGSEWDSLKTIPFHEESEQPKETDAERIKRQSDKILAAYLYDPTYMAQKSVSISPDERARALGDLNSGAFSEAKQSEILQSVAIPAGEPGHEDYSTTLMQISGRQPARILAFATLGPAAANAVRDAEVTIDDNFQNQLKILLDKCPTPIEFAPHEEAMMTNLERAGNPPAKLAQYSDSFEHFKQSVYGKRYEYFQALEVLKHAATQQYLQQQAEADRPHREAELRQLQTTVIPPQESIDDSASYMPSERRDLYRSQQDQEQ